MQVCIYLVFCVNESGTARLNFSLIKPVNSALSILVRLAGMSDTAGLLILVHG